MRLVIISIKLFTRQTKKGVLQTHLDKFALVSDERFYRNTHYLGMYVSYHSNNAVRYVEAMLTSSPLNDETCLSPDKHRRMIEFVLSTFGMSLDSVILLVGENASTKKDLALKVPFAFVGCATHRFYLDVKDIISGNSKFVGVVHKLMSKIKNFLPAKKLCAIIPLKPLLDNATRRSST